jgi:leucyl aminopeptidase (aminopeptidase T)
MPGITEETALRTFPHDYRLIRERVGRICDLFDEAEFVHITTEKGTRLSFSIKGRKGHGRKGGIYTEKGAWGNLPCGEAFIAPVEGTAKGVYVVDASHSGLGKVETPIRIEVEDGKATAIRGGPQAACLIELLEKVKNPDAFNLAEFGIGCNDHARVCGLTLEDEKSLGTCHLALGDNALFGGRTEAGIHLDGVLDKPTILFNDKAVMSQGKLTI